MASSRDTKTTRGYTVPKSPSKREGSNSTSFLNDINTLSAMLQQGGYSQSSQVVHQRVVQSSNRGHQTLNSNTFIPNEFSDAVEDNGVTLMSLQQPLVPYNSVATVTDHRKRLAATSTSPEQQSTNDLANKPLPSSQLTKPHPVVDKDEIDSEEEGEIDEAKEDIEHLYNDFDDSTANNVQTNNNVDSDIDEMFGEDEEKTNMIKNVKVQVDQAFDKIIREGDQPIVANANETLFHNSPPHEMDVDENDMFGESSDEDSEVNFQVLPCMLQSESSTFEVNAHNVQTNHTDGSRNEENKDDMDMFGSSDEDETSNKRKQISFCIDQTISESSVVSKTQLIASGTLKPSCQVTSIPNTRKLLNHTSNQPKSLLKSSLKKIGTTPKVKRTFIFNTSSSNSFQKNTHDGPQKRSYYPSVHPDKFWSSLRGWDFVQELNDEMKKTRRPKINGQNSSDSRKKRQFDEMRSEKPQQSCLPDSFDSVAQYKALWAPLLIEEAKAQILSEVISSQSSPHTAWLNKSRIKMGVVVKVELSRSRRGVSFANGNEATSTIEPTHLLHLRPVTRGASIGCPVGPNDLVLFTREASIVELALCGMALNFDAGDESTFYGNVHQRKGRLGFVGQAVNYKSHSVDGLLVRVSKKNWDEFASLNEMFVIRIGSNITAFREFNALLRLDEVPLSKYLISGNIDSTLDQKVYKHANDSNESKYDPLSHSGLPIGFRIYVKSKMNVSQQQAITASAKEYGCGGFTLIKGPPGTGKSTTLVSILNALHLRQYQEYYECIERIVTNTDATIHYEELALLNKSSKVKPRILVCAPSNAAIDNVVQKIMHERFVDGNGSKYSPSIVRVGTGKVNEVAKNVHVQDIVNSFIEQGENSLNLEATIESGRKELKQLVKEIQKIKVRIQSLVDASPYGISEDWEIRINEEANDAFRILFVNHRSKTTTFDIPPKVRPTEKALSIKQLPHYVALLKSLTKCVEKHNNKSSLLEKYIILQNHATIKRERKSDEKASNSVYNELETHQLNSAHIVLTTLGSAGSRAVESANKFEVIVIDEAAQSSEMSTLVSLQLGTSHCILIGDPQQLPATIFNLSGRSNKYDRSLFQRLEQCGHPVVLLNQQYRMHPMISDFPRHIFYKGMIKDGLNTQATNFGGALKAQINHSFPHFKPVTILDLDSKEEREGTGLSNMQEAKLALHLYMSLDRETAGLLAERKVAIITPYAQQTVLLHKLFQDAFGSSYSARIEISTVDAFQGREAGIVLYSCVRAGGKGSGIGFLSDVQRMNVAITRAKYFLFIIARSRSIMVNHYWRKLIRYAREKKSLIHVPINTEGQEAGKHFPKLAKLAPVYELDSGHSSEDEYSA